MEEISRLNEVKYYFSTFDELTAKLHTSTTQKNQILASILAFLNRFKYNLQQQHLILPPPNPIYANQHEYLLPSQFIEEQYLQSLAIFKEKIENVVRTNVLDNTNFTTIKTIDPNTNLSPPIFDKSYATTVPIFEPDEDDKNLRNWNTNSPLRGTIKLIHINIDSEIEIGGDFNLPEEDDFSPPIKRKLREPSRRKKKRGPSYYGVKTIERDPIVTRSYRNTEIISSQIEIPSEEDIFPQIFFSEELDSDEIPDEERDLLLSKIYSEYIRKLDSIIKTPSINISNADRQCVILNNVLPKINNDDVIINSTDVGKFVDVSNNTFGYINHKCIRDYKLIRSPNECQNVWDIRRVIEDTNNNFGYIIFTTDNNSNIDFSLTRNRLDDLIQKGITFVIFAFTEYTTTFRISISTIDEIMKDTILTFASKIPEYYPNGYPKLKTLEDYVIYDTTQGKSNGQYDDNFLISQTLFDAGIYTSERVDEFNTEESDISSQMASLKLIDF